MTASTGAPQVQLKATLLPCGSALTDKPPSSTTAKPVTLVIHRLLAFECYVCKSFWIPPFMTASRARLIPSHQTHLAALTALYFFRLSTVLSIGRASMRVPLLPVTVVARRSEL